MDYVRLFYSPLPLYFVMSEIVHGWILRSLRNCCYQIWSEMSLFDSAFLIVFDQFNYKIIRQLCWKTFCTFRAICWIIFKLTWRRTTIFPFFLVCQCQYIQEFFDASSSIVSVLRAYCSHKYTVIIVVQPTIFLFGNQKNNALVLIPNSPLTSFNWCCKVDNRH